MSGLCFLVGAAQTQTAHFFPFEPLAKGSEPFNAGDMSRWNGSNSNTKWCLRSFRLGMRPAHGVHPRHPPRTFPLGLLGPRCLGLALFLALPHCGAGARAPDCLGGGRNPPPSFGLLLAVVVQSLQCRTVLVVRQACVVRFNVPSESALAQPPSSFSRVSLSQDSKVSGAS